MFTNSMAFDLGDEVNDWMKPTSLSQMMHWFGRYGPRLPRHLLLCRGL